MGTSSVRHERLNLLTESIYDAAVDPQGWAQVMGLLTEEFASPAGALYFLDGAQRTMRPVQIDGISDGFQRCFNDRYFTRDNPWIKSDPLHRVGVVRTDTRLAAYFGDPQILRRSQYYNDWMRPQRFDHTLGTTLLSEGGVIANLTLLRSTDRGGYSAPEVRRFASLCGHLTRSLRISRRIEAATAEGSPAETLDRLAMGAALLDLHGKVLHANATAEALFRQGDGVAVRNGRLAALGAVENRELQALLRQIAHQPSAEDGGGPVRIAIARQGDRRPLILSAIRLSSHRRILRGAQPAIFVIILEPESLQPAWNDQMRQRYGLTPAEARLALALLTGNGLRAVAGELGITYETARSYMKVLFHKTDTRRQSELVLRLTGQWAAPTGLPQ